MSKPAIELRVWRQFVILAEELHFGRAATRLHMTQPPLTQAIAQLERVLGLRLFDRTKRSVRLTAAGTALWPQAQDVLARAEALPEQAKALGAGEAGRLRLGFVSTAGFSVLPGWVRRYRERYPRVHLELLEATGDLQLQAFGHEELDAGLMLHTPGLEPAGLARRLVRSEPLLLALPGHHWLAAGPSLALDAVLKEPLVIFPRRILPSLHDAIFAMYHAAGRAPQVAQEAIQMQTIVNLVSAGLGVAWVPQSVQQFQRPGVVYRGMVGRKAARVPVCETSLVWPSASANPCVERFLALAADPA